MSEDGLKEKVPRRASTLLVALSIGVAGIAWGGCGGGSSDSTSEAQQQIEKGAEEAKQGVANGSEEAQKGIEKGKEEAQKGIQKGKEEAERRIEEAENHAPGY